ncbi:MAG TPA: hypothetical protein PKA55_04430 [Rhodoblastus sp.]|nr:hypothetical protein [Rhodoblastus sp.]
MLVAQKRAQSLRLRRFRDNPISHLPTPFGMLFRLIVTMSIAVALAMMISHLGPQLGA